MADRPQQRNTGEFHVTGEHQISMGIARYLEHERRIDALERETTERDRKQAERDKEGAVAMTEIRHRLSAIEDSERRNRQMWLVVLAALIGLAGSVIYGIYAVGEKFGKLDAKIGAMEEYRSRDKP